MITALPGKAGQAEMTTDKVIQGANLLPCFASYEDSELYVPDCCGPLDLAKTLIFRIWRTYGIYSGADNKLLWFFSDSVWMV